MSALLAPTRPAPILPALFASLWLLDTAATVFFVSEYGLHTEANPVMRHMIEAIGIAGFVLVKAALLMLWLIVQQRARVWIHYLFISVLAPVAVLAVVVAWGAP